MMSFRYKGSRIIRVVDFLPYDVVKKHDGKTYEITCAVIEELALGGELFFYVYQCGSFPENIARYYFHQMVEAVEEIHNAGFAHRDIKLNNVLLDENLNIKFADFGFAGRLDKNKDNLMRTNLGTEPYKAPEINEGKPYKGVQADIFSLGVLLFTTVAGL